MLEVEPIGDWGHISTVCGQKVHVVEKHNVICSGCTDPER